jgi:uncharacterized membrane protein YhhN
MKPGWNRRRILDLRFQNSDVMNKKLWIAAYLGALAVDLIAVYSNFDTVRYITKPMLMPLLVGYFISNTSSTASSLKKWVILALAFSWAGDVLLMFDQVDEIFFISGLVAFLWAHIWYIIFLQSVTKIEKIGSNALLLVPGLFWLVTLMDILNPSSLGILQWPVQVYGIVLIAMFSGALYMGFVKKKSVGLLIILGALFFVISDSLLALNKFHKEFKYAGIAVMCTYGIAQLLIALGVTKYITSASKQ